MPQCVHGCTKYIAESLYQLNIPCSPAWTVKIQNRVSEALAEPDEELRSKLSEQSQLFVDESPTRENKQKAWLWVAVAPLMTVFKIFANRSREPLVSLLGNYQGIHPDEQERFGVLFYCDPKVRSLPRTQNPKTDSASGCRKRLADSLQ